VSQAFLRQAYRVIPKVVENFHGSYAGFEAALAAALFTDILFCV
jgi:hypothetical protein